MNAQHKPVPTQILEPQASSTNDYAWTASIDDPETIRELVQALIQHEVSGVVRKNHAGFPIRPVALVGDRVHWRLATAIVAAPCEIELEGYNSVFYLPVEKAEQRGDTLITPMPSSIRQARRRWHRRAEPSAATSVRILGGPSAGRSGTIRNLSYSGLLVELDGDSMLLPGQKLPHVLVELNGSSAISLGCEVRFAKTEGNRISVGLKVLSCLAPRDWQGFVDDCLHPMTRAGGPQAEAQWRLFDRCGYFRLSGKSPEDFMRLRRAYVSVTKQLDQHPHLATQVVWGEDQAEEVVAAATAVKVYAGTWLGIQMAKESGDAPDGTPGRQVLRELNYRVYEHVQQDPNLQWFFTCIQAKRVWTRYVFHDYPQSLVDSGDAAIVRFRALEINTRADWDDIEETDAEIELAESGDLDLLCAHIKDSRPDAYCEALDLVRERISMTENNTQWRRSRLERDRVILVAKRNGQTTAAAVLEMAPDGVQLFGLLDLARLYVLRPGGEDDIGALLEAAKGWFSSYDKDQFVCYLEEGVPVGKEIVARAVDLGEADMCILAARRIPELLENIHKVAAPKSAEPESETTQVG